MDIATGEAPAAAAERHDFEFSGRASEYFGIWIVNVLLTIVTLGIYSAWAKVRRKRYFYGNTRLAGRAFDYHARGGQILVGRLVVFGFIILYDVLFSLVPPVGLVLFLVFVGALPWLISRALRFNARVTSYRNVRFDFVGGYWGAAHAFFLGGFLATVSIGILAPVASRWMVRYVFSNLRYGGRPFAADPALGALYRVWVLPAVVAVVGLAVVFALGALLAGGLIMALSGGTGVEGGVHAGVVLAIYVALFAVMLVYGLAYLLYMAGVRNVGYSAVVFDGRHRLASSVPRWRYAWVAVSNVVVTVFTFGLMRPWAAVRTARLLAAHTAMTFVGPVGEVMSEIEADGTAIGSEYVDLEGIEIGL